MSENQQERVLGPGAVGDVDEPGDPTTPVEAPQESEPEQPQAQDDTEEDY